MVKLVYGKSAYQRSYGNLPELPVVNMFVEQSLSDEEGIILQSRPGMVSAREYPTGPVQGVFQEKGVLEGRFFCVSGGFLYCEDTLLGPIEGDLRPSFAASGSELLITRGTTLYTTNGTTLSSVAFPDNLDVLSVSFYAGYFLAVQRNSNKWYFSNILNGSVWDPLDFASAENSPDFLLEILIFTDMLAMIGESTIEFWTPSGTDNLPFVPLRGRVYNRGMVTSRCAEVVSSRFFWVGDDKIVYEGSNTPVRVSNPGIEEKISQSQTYYVFSFIFAGHEFFCVRLDQGTWALDTSTGEWCEFSSYSHPNWRAGCSCQGPFFGDTLTGHIWTFKGFSDPDGQILERRFRAGLQIDEGIVIIRNLWATVNPGQSLTLEGIYENPYIEVRISRDGGQTWGNWKQTPLGFRGKHRTKIEWRSLGFADSPGFLAEFRVTDPVPFRLSGVDVNVAKGGGPR